MMYLCSVVSHLSNYGRCQSNKIIDTGVILIGDTIQENQCLNLAEMMRCQVIRLWE